MEYPGRRKPSLPPTKSLVGMPSIRPPKLRDKPCAGQLKLDAPPTVARLDGAVHRSNFRSGRCVKRVGCFLITSGRFHAEAEGNISIRVFGRVEQPGIPHKAKVP